MDFRILSPSMSRLTAPTSRMQHQRRFEQSLLAQRNEMPQTAVVNGVVAPLSTALDLIKLQTFQSVVAGQQSVMQLPVGQNGWCYHRLWLYINDSTPNPLSDSAIAASLINIQLIIDGDPVWNLSAADLQMLLAHWAGEKSAQYAAAGGAPLTGGLGNLLFPFARSWFISNRAGEEASAIGSLDRKSIVLQLTWANGSTAAGATVYAEVAPNCNLGRYIAIRQFPTPVLGAGLNQLFRFLPTDPNRSLSAIHFQTSIMSQITILPDGQTPLINQLPITVLQNMIEAYRFTMQTGAGTPWTNIPINRRLLNSDCYNLGNPNFLIQPFFTSSPAASIRCMAEIVESKAAA